MSTKEFVSPSAERPRALVWTKISCNTSDCPPPVGSFCRENLREFAPPWRSGKMAMGAEERTRSYPRPEARGTRLICERTERSRQSCRTRAKSPVISRLRRLFCPAASAPSTDICTS
ncbi:MAG: hypothetical protein EBT77_06700 [Verrucomicrobia bacterium]|nr:hypothetical protein [Verrucomicrobiota bacterium]